MDPRVQETCEELRANHPRTTELRITLADEFTCDDELAAVFGDLRLNHTVKTVVVSGPSARVPPLFAESGEDRWDALSKTCIRRLAHTVREHPTVQTLVFAEENYLVRGFRHLVSAFKRNPGLRKLRFSRVTLGRNIIHGLQLMLDSNALESLEIDRCKFTHGLSFSDLSEAFQRTSHLRELRLSTDENTPRNMIMEIPHVVRAIQSLETLDVCLYSNPFILAHVAHASTGHRSLKCFKIHFNSGRGRGLVDMVCARDLQTMVQNSPVLAEIELVDCHMGPRETRFLADGLASHDCNIQKLRLVSCGLGDEQTQDVAVVLFTNRSITELDLSRNDIGNRGAIALGSMLEQNNVIVTLKLSSNPIGHEGFLALANAFDTNTVLEDVDISCKPEESVNHDVGDEAAARFAQMLEQHSNVKRFAIGGFGTAGLNEFIQRLPNMESVVKLVLCTVELPPRDRPAIAVSLLSAIEQNEILEEFEFPDLFRHDGAAELGTKYILDLNRSGRKIMKDSDGLSLGVWPFILGRSCCSDDGIFYFLREEPEMVRSYRANRNPTVREDQPESSVCSSCQSNRTVRNDPPDPPGYVYSGTGQKLRAHSVRSSRPKKKVGRKPALWERLSSMFTRGRRARGSNYSSK